MRKNMVTGVVAALVVVLLGSSGLAQDTTATIRTYQGVSYKVVDPSLEVFYTIGEPKEKSAESSPRFGSMINISTNATTTTGAEQPAEPGKEDKLLRGHGRATDIVVSRQGAETRIAWEQIRAVRFARKSVTDSRLLPPYLSHFKHSAIVSLVSGQQIEGDYVNLGATIVRATSEHGRVDMPWEEVESIVFDR